MIAFGIGLVCTAICELVQPDQTSWDVDAGDQAGFFVTQSLAMLGGFAIATLLLNTPASIVLFVVYRFVLPGVFAGLAALSDWFEKVAPWLDFQAAQDDIYEWDLSGTEEWSHLRRVRAPVAGTAARARDVADPAGRGQVGIHQNVADTTPVGGAAVDGSATLRSCT